MYAVRKLRNCCWLAAQVPIFGAHSNVHDCPIKVDPLSLSLGVCVAAIRPLPPLDEKEKKYIHIMWGK